MQPDKGTGDLPSGGTGTYAPPPGTWADALCLDASNAAPGGAYNQWTDVDLFFDRYVGELTLATEGDQSEDQGKALDPEAEYDPQSNPSGEGTHMDVEKAPPSKPKGSQVKRWKNRTPKQHQDNILAQRRYRQRRKAKVEGLKEQVEMLTERLKELESSSEEVHQLERSNQEYEQQLWSQNREVRQVQEQLHSQAQASRAADEGLDPKGSTQLQLEQATQAWLSQTLVLAKVMNELGLQPRPSDQGLTAEGAKALDDALHRVMELCRLALRLGDLDLSNLVAASERAGAWGRTAVSGDDMPDYNTVSQELKLSPEQYKKARALWQETEQTMVNIWKERHELHSQWCEVVEAETSPPTSRSQGTVLWAILNKLQANLKAEQVAYCQQHHQVFRHLLSHTQSAWLVIRAYPHHCDCFAFLCSTAGASNGASSSANS
ncbi:hypothetical protein WJX73_003442 [Symbiochloris irregularis]|uniref:BZIP domain-containing protein n=1 Tax=Symbiochloris irregularis TaxID=706552 RepID=A0AAW1Q2G8_9CHLO